MSNNNAKPNPVICENRKARFNYEILETIEAGLVLKGTEVKALREGRGDISESYGFFKNGEVFLMNSYIGEYSHGNQLNHEPRRLRKLLLNKKELLTLDHRRQTERLTLIPLRLYWVKDKVKVDLALARGRKKEDKREVLRDRDWKRTQARLLKR